MDWLWNSIVGFVLGTIPTWAWVVLAGIAIGWAWKTFGTQGVLGALVAVVTLGAYRQGWRDHDQGKPPIVPVEPLRPPQAAPVPRKRRRTLMDILNGR
jgi:hypothetical protein